MSTDISSLMSDFPLQLRGAVLAVLIVHFLILAVICRFFVNAILNLICLKEHGIDTLFFSLKANTFFFLATRTRGHHKIPCGITWF